MTTQLGAIKQIAINARDLPRATAFYRDRLGIRHLFDAPPQMSFFDCAGIRLLIGVPERGDAGHGSSILYFDVKDIDAAHADLSAKGVTFRQPPHFVTRLADRELWLAFFEDSEGNVLALTSEKPVQANAGSA